MVLTLYSIRLIGLVYGMPTPQLFPTAQLKDALQQALAQGVAITDEASAMEWAGLPVLLVQGHADNIKITQAEDLALAAFYLEHSV